MGTFSQQHAWRLLDDVERNWAFGGDLWGPRLYDSVGRALGSGYISVVAWADESLGRVERVRRALTQSESVARGLITQKLRGIDLAAIWPILIGSCKEAALLYGAGIGSGAALGGAIGFLFGGLGAVPGAIAGGAIGAEATTFLLGVLGLKATVEGLTEALPEILGHYRDGFIEAWGPAPDRGDSFAPPRHDASVDKAAWHFGLGHVALIVILLGALIAYVTRGRGDRGREQAFRDIRENPKLGPEVERWLRQNENALAQEPGLRQSQRAPASGAEGGNAEAATSNAAPQRASKLAAGTAEHKADRWAKYQARGGQKGYEAWSKQYDTNMQNYVRGAAREEQYREAMGATEGLLKTPLTNRQIDVLIPEQMYAGQVKTGPVSLTKENVVAIQKDAELVKEGWTVEHILEGGASQPYLDALERAGIDVHVGPKLPSTAPGGE